MGCWSLCLFDCASLLNREHRCAILIFRVSMWAVLSSGALVEQGHTGVDIWDALIGHLDILFLCVRGRLSTCTSEQSRSE